MSYVVGSNYTLQFAVQGEASFGHSVRRRDRMGRDVMTLRGGGKVNEGEQSGRGRE